MDSLWGEISNETINTPKGILEEQAEYLKENTGKLVYAEVERNFISEKKNEGILVFDFLIKGRYMDDFSYKLLSIRHPIDLYPVQVIVDQKAFKEIEAAFEGQKFILNANTFEADKEKIYVEILKAVFTSTRSKNLITGIISLSSKEPDMPF